MRLTTLKVTMNMKTTIRAVAGAAAVLMLVSCGGNDSSTDGSMIAQPRATPTQNLSHEVGAAFGANGAVVDEQPEGADLALLTGASSDRLRTAAPRLGATASTDDPAQLLGPDRVIDNPYQPGDRGANSPFPLIKIDGLGDRPFPTGKWYKGFFYRTPARLDSNFADAPAGDPAAPHNGQNDTAQESVFAFPNRLNLDDRIPLVSVAFPRPRYIAPALDPNADGYKLLNRFVTDDVFYPVIASPLADLQLAASTGVDATLTRTITHQDELTVTTRWQNADASRQMELLAAVGSPYVTVRYQNIAPVVSVGQGLSPRLAKDPNTNLPLTPLTLDYTKWESVNGLVAVAASDGDLSSAPNQPFVEATALVNGVKTPILTGTAFRFIYRVPDPARPSSPRTNNNAPPVEGLINRVMNVYTSSPISLHWDGPSRSYVATQPFNGVIRAAFVNEAVIADISRDDPTTLSFPAAEAALYKYKDEYPISGEVTAQYDGNTTANVLFVWATANMSGAKPNAANLLMTAFEATQVPSLQNVTKLPEIGYYSNWGRMSGVVGGHWNQVLNVPAILQNQTPDRSYQLWYGSGAIKESDKARIGQMLVTEATDTQSFITHCNYESYTCGKYIANLARLALIADQLGDAGTRRQLIAFMKQNINPWFDGADPTDPDIGHKTDPSNFIFDYFVYDRTNKGLVTFRPYKRGQYDDDFYNLVYTDHMFHYGYFIYASAVIARLDEDATWFNKYKPYVDLLVRDIANPSASDAYFPISRTFDWFKMQNQADSGPTANGPNTESSSESINSNYALALWGDVTGNANLKALASVMTAAEIRTAQAIYQVRPETSVLRQDGDLAGVAPVTVTVQTRAGTAQAVLDANRDVTRGIVWSQITEHNIFFGPRKQYLVGIQVLPVTPISEYVLSKSWAKAHETELLALEASTTANYTLAISNVPGPDAECAVFAQKTPHDAQPPDTYNWGGGCAAAARVENAWRQILVSLNGVNDPAGSYDRFAALVDKSVAEAAFYTSNLSNPNVHPGSSTDAQGSKPDLLRQTSTPSTNTNVFWWLSVRKP